MHELTIYFFPRCICFATSAAHRKGFLFNGDNELIVRLAALLHFHFQ
jgi:hypothetical protein